MALDKNLFTLNLEPSKIEPGATDLVDPSGTVHYRKHFVPTDARTYLFSLSEPLSESILATAAAPAATSKEKVIQLHNPSATVPLTFKGTLTFKWCFTWEEHDYEWKRESCYMIRKPDPPVLVAVTKEPAGKIKTATVQILDYNLNRFDIEDRKGLEIVLLTSLLSFSDYSEQLRTKSNDTPSTVANVPPAAAAPPPPPPPKPEGWQEDQIAILQAKEQRTVNEVVIGEAGNVEEYVRHCVSLLNDDTLLFITLRSLTPSSVSKVVQVAEATKRTRYKASGYDDEEELHQYVDMSFDAEAGKKGKGPRVINLDDRPTPSASTYQPPNTLTIHLSKISMPELEPKSNKSKNSKPSPTSGRHAQAPSESSDPEPSKASKSNKQKWRQSSPGTAGLAPPSQALRGASPTGLRAKFSALTSRSSSPPPGPRPSSAPDQSSMPSFPSFPPSQPQSPPQPRSGRSPQQSPPLQPQPRSGRSAQPPPQQPPPSQSLRGQQPQPQPRQRPVSQYIMQPQPQHSYPPAGRGRQMTAQPLPIGPPQQNPGYPPRPMMGDPSRGMTAAPYPQPVPPSMQNAYSVPPGFAGGPMLPQQPQPERAPAKGFFSRR